MTNANGFNRVITYSLLGCLAIVLGCESAPVVIPVEAGKLTQAVEAPSCDWVPVEYRNLGDGCDCPLDGDTSCDPDCATNGEGSWCGCDYCFDGSAHEAVDPPPGWGNTGSGGTGGAPECSWVPEEFHGIGDGCDCPLDGDTSCDPDCANNGKGSWCGCDFCFDASRNEAETPPPGWGGNTGGGGTGGSAECSWVPDEYQGIQDGCDCPTTGDTSCDPDCANNGKGSWCGCDFCFDASGNEAEEPPPGPVKQFSVTVVASRRPEDFALSATNTVTIADDVLVLRPGGMNWDKLAGVVSAGTVSVGQRSVVANVDAVGSVALGAESLAAGRVAAGQGITTAAGTRTTLEKAGVDVGLTTMTWSVEFPASPPPARLVTSGQVAALEPGHYGDTMTQAGAELRLRSGAYTFERLSLLQDSRLRIDSTRGPVQVSVRDSLVYRPRLEEVGTRGDLLLAVAGAAPIDLATPFSGTLVAPNALITLGAVARPALTAGQLVDRVRTDIDTTAIQPWWSHSGAFFGRDIDVRPGVILRHDYWTRFEDVFDILRPDVGSSCSFAMLSPCGGGGFVCDVLDRQCKLPLGAQCLEHAGCVFGTHCSGATRRCAEGIRDVNAVCSRACEGLLVCNGQRCQSGLGTECQTTADCAPAPCGERPVNCIAGRCEEDYNAIPQRNCPTVQGDATCAYGDPNCNTCVHNVVESFESLSVPPTATVVYQLPGTFNWLTRHIQSVQRIPGLGNRWFATSTSAGGGEVMLHATDATGTGGPLNGGRATFQKKFNVPTTDHPGGMQAVGQMLVVGTEKDGGPGFVDFFDLAQVNTSSSIPQIGRLFLNGSRGEPGQTSTTTAFPTSVAMVRLDREAGGDYLLFVHDKDTRDAGWFYRGNPRSPSSFRFIDYFRASEVIGWNTPAQWGKYQNTNFVTECGTGDIYMIGMGNPTMRNEWVADAIADVLETGIDLVLAPAHISCLFGLICDVPSVNFNDWGKDLLDLFKVDLDPTGSVELTQVVRRSINPLTPWKTCNLRAGGGIHVTPSHELVLYCSPHGVFPTTHVIEERRQRVPSPCSDANGNLDPSRPGCLGIARQALIVDPPYCPPGQALNPSTNTCVACGVRQFVDPTTRQCATCPAGSVATATGCSACPPRTVSNATNTCQPCAANQISSNNTCVTCPFGQAVDVATNRCVFCEADAVVDWATTGLCAQTVRRTVARNGVSGDHCPNDAWVEVRNISSGPYGTAYTSFKAQNYFAPDITSEATCESSTASIGVYHRSGSTLVTDVTRSGTGNFLGPCDPFVCPAELCALPAVSALSRAAVQTAGNTLRIRVTAQRGSSALGTGVALTLTPTNPSNSCLPR